jgi:hypothetical protein
MQSIILLNYDENTKQVEEEEKIKFLRNLLEQMGVPIDDFWTAGTSLSIDQRVNLRTILATYAIQVIDDLDGHMQVYVERELVGEWFKSTYKLKRDLRELDTKKQLYMEMTVNFWTIFEEQEK